MRDRNSFETSMRRIRAHLLRGNFQAAFDECDLAEERDGPHWRIHFLRGGTYTAMGMFNEAEAALQKVLVHTIGCPDPLCLSQGAYMALFANQYLMEEHLKALGYINEFIRTAPADIEALYWRGLLFKEKWEDSDRQENQYLDEALRDLRKAYALIGNLPDEKFYRLKVIRDFAQARTGEMESVCRDSQKMYVLMEILEPIPDSPPVNEGPDAVDVRSLMDPFMPADLKQLEIGSDLAVLLWFSAETQDHWGAALEILDEIKPLVEKHRDADAFAVLLLLESVVNLEIYNKTRSDVNYLNAAISNLADLRRLSTEGTLTEETLENIEDLETAIDAQ